MRTPILALVLVSLLSLPAIAAAGPTQPTQPAPAAQAPVAAAQTTPATLSFPLAPLPMFDVSPASFCSAQATCADGTTRSCSCTSSSCSCSAVDQNCDTGVRGQVTCGSTTYYCPWNSSVCPVDCNDPPRTKCIPTLPCQTGCGNCGPYGVCAGGACVCSTPT